MTGVGSACITKVLQNRVGGRCLVGLVVFVPLVHFVRSANERLKKKEMNEKDEAAKINETNQTNVIDEPCRFPALNPSFVNLLPSIFTVNAHDLPRVTPAS